VTVHSTLAFPVLVSGMFLSNSIGDNTAIRVPDLFMIIPAIPAYILSNFFLEGL